MQEVQALLPQLFPSLRDCIDVPSKLIKKILLYIVAGMTREMANSEISPFRRGIPCPILPEKEPASVVLFRREEVLQEAVGWYASAHAHLLEILSLVEQLQQCAPEEAVQIKHQISRSIDGESGRFPAEASYRGRPLLLGDSPDGVLRFPLYTGYGRPGFPTLHLLERQSDPPIPSELVGEIKRFEGRRLYLDTAASIEDGVYTGCAIRIEGERGAQLGAVVGYRGEERELCLADSIDQESIGKPARYCLRSRLSNCYLVGSNEVVVACELWSDLELARSTLLKWIESTHLHLLSLRGEWTGEADETSLRFLETNYSILSAHTFWGDFVRRLEQN